MKNILIMKKKIELKKIMKRYKQEVQELRKQLNDKNDYKNTEENIPYLETEEEAAENIADIYERKDNEARTFAPPHNVDDNTRKKDNMRKKYNFDDIKDDIDNFDFDDKRKNKSNFNENGIDINGLDKDGYNINGIDKYGVNKDGFNINNIKRTRKKYPNKKVNLIYNDGIYYDQYGFDEKGFNKDGYDIYGFDKKGLNKDGLNKYGYKKSSGKRLNISSLPVLLSKIYTNNSSKEPINDVKQLVKNLYKNKQITKQVYNTLSFLELYK